MSSCQGVVVFRASSTGAAPMSGAGWRRLASFEAWFRALLARALAPASTARRSAERAPRCSAPSGSIRSINRTPEGWGRCARRHVGRQRASPRNQPLSWRCGL
eukprot:1759315-Pyramimonas_sp.AAC.1